MVIDFQIPESALNYMRALAERDTHDQWEIGDLLVSVWDELEPHLLPKERRQGHAKMIHQFAKASGIAHTTLRDREVVARFFEPKVRSNVLTFHQHRAVKSAGDDWEEWMIWAEDNLATVDQIRTAIKEQQEQVPEWRKRMESITGIATKILQDTDAPEYAREGADLILMIVSDALVYPDGEIF